MRRSTYLRTLVVLAAVGLLALGACKKDPPAAPATEPGKTEAATPAAGGAPATPGAVTSPTATPDKTAAAAPATPETPATPATPATPPAPTPAPAVAAAAAVTPAAIPADIIGYISISSFDNLVATAKTITDRVNPMPMLDQMMLEGLKGSLGFKDLNWLDRTKPMRLVLLNPKVYPQAAVLVLPATSQDAAKAALPDTKKENDAGNQYSMTPSFQVQYVNLLANAVVVTQAPEAFAKAKDFVEKDLATVTTKDVLESTWALDNINIIYKTEIDALEAQTKQLAASPAMMPIPGVGDLVAREYEMIFGAVREMQRADVAIQFADDVLRLPITLTSSPTSGLAKFAAAMHGRTSTLVDVLPAGSYVVMGGNIDPKSMAAWAELGMTFITQGLKLPEADAQKVRTLYEQNLALQTGDFAMAFYRQGNFAFAVDSVSGTTDGAKLREATFATYELLYTKLVEMGKALATENNQPIPPQIDLSSFPKAIQSLGTMLAPMGITLALQSEDYKGTKIDVLDLKLDFTKLPNVSPSDAQVVQAIVGDHVQLALAFGPTQMLFSMGPEAVARIKQTLEGAKPLAADPSFAKTRSNLQTAGGFSFYVDPVAGVKAFAAIPDLAAVRPAIEGMQSKGGVALSAQARSANQVAFVLDVPLTPIVELVKVFSGM